MTPTFIDSRPYKTFQIGLRKPSLNNDLRWEPVPDSRECRGQRVRFADRSRCSQRSLCKYYTLKNPESQQLFLEVDHISEGERGRGEVAPLLLNPGPLFSPTEATGDTVPNDLLLSVGNHLGRQPLAPLVQLVVGQLGPDGTRPEAVDLLVSVRDETDQVVTGGNEGNVVRGHCGNRLHPTSEKVNGNLELFLTIR